MARRFCVAHGTILRLDYAGVVLQFRRTEDGVNTLDVWRLPEADFNSENIGIDDEGNESWHGVAVRHSPPPGPHRAT